MRFNLAESEKAITWRLRLGHDAVELYGNDKLVARIDTGGRMVVYERANEVPEWGEAVQLDLERIINGQ